MLLLIATHNSDKLREIRETFNFPGIDVVPACDVPNGDVDVVEDGSSFSENALKKARAVRDATGCWTMADDSGIAVDALGGKPGIHSARYAGEPCDNEANNRKLLASLQGVADRTARYHCCLALAAPDGREWTCERTCEGSIAAEPHGCGGFGYDPIFYPAGSDRTFGEWTAEAKNAISHRGKAVRDAVKLWKGVLVGNE